MSFKFNPAKLKLAMVPLMIAGLAACAQPFNARVQRFSAQLPAPQGQSFAVVADDAAQQGGLEFAQYARLVEAQMAKLGYVPAGSASTASLVVRFDFGVDEGRERIRASAFSDPFYSPWSGYRRGNYYGRPLRYYPRSAWGYGWHDPFFDGGYESYTVYTSGIEVKIDRRDNGERLFEGKAEALSTSNRLPYLVPNLVEAIFTDFPGNSGETVRISIAPEKKRRD